MVDPVEIFGFIFLIVATSYFVAAEFAFVKVRSTRIDQLVLEGNKKAFKVQKVLSDLDGYLSATQLGITITSLGLGWLGEPTVEGLLKPLLDKTDLSEGVIHSISFILAFIIVTFLHVVLGELTPKSIAIQKAESICLSLAPSLLIFYKVMYPFIWVLNSSANLIVKSMGLKNSNSHNEEHSEEEIKLIVSTSNDINNDEKTMVKKIFDFDETIMREIMVHRKDMNCIYLNDSIEEILEFVKNTPNSRFPVVGEDKDDIKGYVNIRDLYSTIGDGKGLESIIREVPKIYETTPIKKVLSKLQKEKAQLAIALDEYGGVAGLVTMEDIVEEIFGDIQDEFDNEINPIRKGKNRWIIEADVHIQEVEKAIEHTFDERKDVITIGGYIMSSMDADQIFVNSKFEFEGKQIEILKMEDNRIVLLSIEREENK